MERWKAQTCAPGGRLLQVPLLLRLGEDERALQKATESGDTDLVYLVLFSMYRTLPLQAFIAAINTRSATRSLFLAYCARTVSPQQYPMLQKQQICQGWVDQSSYTLE